MARPKKDRPKFMMCSSLVDDICVSYDSYDFEHATVEELREALAWVEPNMLPKYKLTSVNLTLKEKKKLNDLVEASGINHQRILYIIRQLYRQHLNKLDPLRGELAVKDSDNKIRLDIGDDEDGDNS